MTGQTVAELLGEWLTPAVVSDTTPAKAANSAKPEDSCGLQPDPAICEGLRISANQPASPGAVGANSQTFAVLRNPTDCPQSEQRRGFSQDSQDSQGVPRHNNNSHHHTRTCTDCAHRLRRGACGEPEAAGLFPPGHGFGIAWAEPGHAQSCPAFETASTITLKASERPYRLSAAEGYAAHADPWDDAAIGLFKLRTARLRRRGFPEDDAEDLAERLHLRDVQDDERALCLECRHLSGTAATGWRCGNWQAAQVARELAGDLATTLQRCTGFSTHDEQGARRHDSDLTSPER